MLRVKGFYTFDFFQDIIYFMFCYSPSKTSIKNVFCV